jgi:hypothetical protein
VVARVCVEAPSGGQSRGDTKPAVTRLRRDVEPVAWIVVWVAESLQVAGGAGGGSAQVVWRAKVGGAAVGRRLGGWLRWAGWVVERARVKWWAWVRRGWPRVCRYSANLRRLEPDRHKLTSYLHRPRPTIVSYCLSPSA